MAAAHSLLHQVPIELGDRSYSIEIGTGLLDRTETWSGVAEAADGVIVTNTTVAPLYAQRLKQAIAARHRRINVVALPDGEEHKNWQTLNSIFDALLEHGCDRK